MLQLSHYTLLTIECRRSTLPLSSSYIKGDNRVALEYSVSTKASSYMEGPKHESDNERKKTS